MVCFQTQKPDLEKFWRALEWNGLVHSLAILNILRPSGTIYGHLVQFMAIWYNLWPFGTIYGHLVQFMAIWYNLWPFGNFVAI
jgi:hypothetical protein